MVQERVKRAQVKGTEACFILPRSPTLPCVCALLCTAILHCCTLSCYANNLGHLFCLDLDFNDRSENLLHTCALTVLFANTKDRKLLKKFLLSSFHASWLCINTLQKRVLEKSWTLFMAVFEVFTSEYVSSLSFVFTYVGRGYCFLRREACFYMNRFAKEPFGKVDHGAKKQWLIFHIPWACVTSF